MLTTSPAWAGNFKLNQTSPDSVTSVGLPNQLQYDWGAIACRVLGFGDINYRLAYLYLEYENLALSSTVITPPVFGRNEGVGYYTSLLPSTTKDFLRLPLLSLPATGLLEDTVGDIYSAYFPSPDGFTGNKLTFVSQTSGTLGMGGRAFSDTVNSKVYGLAIVASPVPGDYTRDLVYARAYFNTTDQLVKLANSQISVTYEIEFP